MIEIKSEKDLVVVPKKYLEGVQEQIRRIVSELNVADIETMRKILSLYDWLDAKYIERDLKNFSPNLRLENIRLLLPQEGSCSYRRNCEINHEFPPREYGRHT